MDPFLRDYLSSEMDRIVAEVACPLSTGLIATSIARHVKAVVEAWPNVTIRGVAP